jgi:hypothetical protein
MQLNVGESKIVGLIKNKKTWISACILVLFAIFYSIGYGSASSDITGKEVSYEQLVKEVKVVEGKLITEGDRLIERKTEVDKTLGMIDEQDAIQKNIDSHTIELSNQTDELKALNANIATKRTELEKLNNGVVAAQGKPRQLSSGHYIVGTDVPSGRYRATNVGRGSNFQVYNSSGEIKVNAILGNSIVGDGDFVFFANDGDIIKTAARVKLVPVE